MKFNFHLRATKAGQDKKAPRIIYFVTYFNIADKRHKFVYPTGFKVAVNHWNAKEQRVKNVLAATDGQQINNFLNTLSTGVNSWSIDKESKRENITPQLLKSFLDDWTGKNAKSEPITLFGFIRQFIAESPQRLNIVSKKTIAERTVQKYRSTLAHLENYAKTQKRKTLDFKDIDLNFYNGFISYLTNAENMKPNTIGKHISVIKTFLGEAENVGGVTVPTAYRGRYFKTLKEDIENVYLNKAELKRLEMLDLSENSRLDRIRDLFLIGTWTGLRFSDFTEITPERIKQNEKGGYYIQLRQAKTGGLVVIPCHEVVLTILKKYDFVLPPAISNQKFNAYLKELCKEVGFFTRVEVTATKGGKSQTTVFEKWERISTHTARRSFATNLYKDGVQAKTIMKITGHNTESSFYKYIVLSNDEHAEIIREHFDKPNTLLSVVSKQSEEKTIDSQLKAS